MLGPSADDPPILLLPIITSVIFLFSLIVLYVFRVRLKRKYTEWFYNLIYYFYEMTTILFLSLMVIYINFFNKSWDFLCFFFIKTYVLQLLEYLGFKVRNRSRILPPGKICGAYSSSLAVFLIGATLNWVSLKF